MQSKKFTLIELLVIIAIIAILFSMIYPAFVQARKKAKEIYLKEHPEERPIVEKKNKYESPQLVK